MTKPNTHVAVAGALVLATMLLAGCEGSSSSAADGGLRLAGYNYTPNRLSRFVITDDNGNQLAADADLPAGAGAGRLGCCLPLQGTTFTVQWEVHDTDEAMRPVDADAPVRTIQKTVSVEVPPSTSRRPGQPRVLGLHFHPDDRVEAEFRSDSSGMRLHHAVGAWVRKIEAVRQFRPDFFEELAEATLPADHGAAYALPDLIDGYREVVPREEMPASHVKKHAFVRWLAVRYQEPDFRRTVTEPADEAMRLHLERTQEIRLAQEAFDAERRRVPADHQALGQASARLRAAREAQDMALAYTATEVTRSSALAQGRAGEDDDEQMSRRAILVGLKGAIHRLRQLESEVLASGEGQQLDSESIALVQAWHDGVEGRNPLPEPVMALFDLLVRDAMLAVSLDSLGLVAPRLQARIGAIASPLASDHTGSEGR
ncbi:DUF3304 domain-containing protein [Cupriavidus agavae]|uniref:Uncharacterized protein DUF3304 n=1 Tax=Cupriavidus agavae TaxID=1001822 RepID=A0A4Q7RT08_9BURK|nr:DUF3304 domain-containing protein [Cupriavidus agavae]RZT36753.1 uncharacterized protein DUF3304 [Cupriavidus agavae]